MHGSHSSICRRMLSGALLCLVLPGGAFSQNPQNTNPQKTNETRVKQQALAIPLGWPVQVNLNNRDRLYGRMGQITDQGFVVQSVNAGKIEERTIVFTDVKAIYRSRRAGPISKKAIAVALLPAFIALGVAFGLALAH